MKRNEEIIDAVDHLAEKSLKFLQELVKTPSLEGDEKNCQLIINEKFHSMGLTVDMWDLPDEELKKHPAYVPTDYTYTQCFRKIGRHRWWEILNVFRSCRCGSHWP